MAHGGATVSPSASWRTRWAARFNEGGYRCVNVLPSRRSPICFSAPGRGLIGAVQVIAAECSSPVRERFWVALADPRR